MRRAGFVAAMAHIDVGGILERTIAVNPCARFSFPTLFSLLLVGLPAVSVADWQVGDPHKMHYPQLPKMDGWDVRAGYYTFLADDWQCSQTGPVNDIHLWVSWKGDQVDWTQLGQIHTAIWSDDRSGAYSKPGTRLWHYDWSASQAQIVPWGSGPQGWYDPSLPLVLPNDHNGVYQINLVDPLQPAFVQQEGTIYWLEVSFVNIVPTADFSTLGWKQSGSPQFEDAAVWRTPEDGWQVLRDPINQGLMDLAFVITPEPSMLGLMLLGGFALVLRRRAR